MSDVTATTNAKSSSGTGKGLEGIVAAQTAISLIDGLNGRLFYRGLDIHDLASHSTFEETTALLWYGRLPNRKQFERFRQKFVDNRMIPNDIVSIMLTLPPKTSAMGVLRTCVSAVATYDPDTGDNSLDANVNKSIRLTASFPTFIAAWHRIRNGLWPISPNPDLGHAANFLYMLTGEVPNEHIARALDIALILHADHGLNASTFAARITSSTLSNLHSAIVSAIGTLKGSLHGGANEQVMRMLLEIGSMERIDQYMRGAFASKKKIPGFGHRVYKADDPRAFWLQKLSKQVGEEAGKTRWFEMSEVIRKAVQEHRALPVNVDFYSASLYYTMGIPTDLFTPIFAISRVAGWTAHVYEQYSDNRLIRPESEYVGPMDVPYQPIDERP
ncbi:MAG: citrate synthase [Chloroflexaceae bacterium]|nr:citrate synthase [Chloroflexaceae bacterium]